MYGITIFGVLLAFSSSFVHGATPVVMWHGLGDWCCNPFSTDVIKAVIENNVPGIYVHSLKIGNTDIEDFEHGYFTNVNGQVDFACNLIASDPQLKDGYNALGLSQGGQFLRAVAQRCPNPPMKNLVSLAGQHQGVYGLPNCGVPAHPLCDYIRRLLNTAAYAGWVQNDLVQAQYWHDPLQEDLYQNYSIFLADINNELSIKQEYVDNLLKLENLILVKFLNDTVVEPVESEWFGFYKSGQAIETETLEESKLYTEDRLGLKTMNEKGKLHFVETEGNHLQFSDEWFIENIIKKWFM